MVDRFKRIFDSLTEEVVVIDRELRIAYANPAWIRRLGLAPSLVLGQPCHQILLEADAPCAIEECTTRQVFATGQVTRMLCLGYRQQDPDRCASLSISPIFDSLGQVTEVVQILHPPLSQTAHAPHRVLQPTERDAVPGPTAFSSSQGQPDQNVDTLLAERLRVVSRISMAVNSTLNPDEILRTAAREMARAFRVKQASIILFDPTSNQGRIAAQYPENRDSTGNDVRLPLTGNPSLEQVIASKQPLAITNTRHDPLTASIREVVELRSIESVLIVPLVVKGEVIGTIGLDAIDEPRVFTSEEIDLAQTMGNQVTIAIDNARLYREVNHHLEEVQILNKVAQATTSTLDFDKMVRRAMIALLGIRNFERVNVLLFDEARGDLLLHPALADSEFFLPRAYSRIPLGKGITGWVAQEGKALRVPDVRQEPRYIAGYQDTLSELAVPIKAGRRTIGVLDVQSTKLDAFSESDVRLLTTLSGQLSTVLENSRLYAQAQQRVRELTSLTQVSQALNEARGLNTILNIVLDKVFTLLGSKEGSIILIDPPSSNRLRIVAQQGLEPEVVENFNSRPVYTHEGTYKRALRTRQIVEVSDTSSDPDFLRDVGSRAEQVTNVPLITDRGPIGLIAADGLPTDDTTRRLLAALAGIAAVAIDKERLHQETVVRLAEVSTLYTLSTQITSSLSTSSVLDSIVSILRMTLDCRACSIFLLNPTKEYLQLETASGPSVAWRGIARLRVGEGISGRAITERRSIYIPDTHLEPDFIFFDPQIRSLLVVPLIIRDEPIGTLSIDDTQPNAFDEEVRLLTIAAAQAAVAIENAQLYESLQASYRQLERTFDELRHLDEMKSELIQNISHELRTPLTFIKGYVELLQDGEMGPLQAEQETAIDIVANKTDLLSRLVDDIVSMLQAGREQFKTMPVSLAEIGRSSVQAALASAAEAGLSLRGEIPDGIPPVPGDKDRLGQVFDNLLQNAIKFTNPGGTIVVRVKDEEARVRVEVEDTGIGIPSDRIPRIFDRFYQVNGTSTRRFGGTGLGLAIVKQIVETHGGEVGVESRLNEGSLFFFAIPKTNTEQEHGGP